MLHQLGHTLHAKVDSLHVKMDQLATQVQDLVARSQAAQSQAAQSSSSSVPGGSTGATSSWLNPAPVAFQLVPSQSPLAPPPPPPRAREPCAYKNSDGCLGWGEWKVHRLSANRARWPVVCTVCYHWLVQHDPPVIDMTYGTNGAIRI